MDTNRKKKNQRKSDAPRERDAKNGDGGQMETPGPVSEQIENSELELTGYTEEGCRLVTNVLIANDNRENNRTRNDRSERDVRLRAVQMESEIADAKFTEISGQWPIILKKNDALEIHEHSELQKKRALDLIEQKNQMIEILKRDLAESDARFLEEQAAQSEDVRILQERIENQVKFIRKQYKNHILCIKSTMDRQREHRIGNADERWNAEYDQTVSVESKSLDDRLAMIEKKENNIMKQYEMNEETIRKLKSRVNAELHDMQREFELIKLKCIDNIEKLNYNYQVLKRREEENASAKAAQRRKINKLQDVLSNKRKILRETKAEFEAKVPSLRDEIERLRRDIERHEKKAERFAEIHEKTFRELWDFSRQQIADCLERIYEIDRIVHETQLGVVDWQPPRELKYLDVGDLPSYRKKPATPNVKSPRRAECDDGDENAYAETRERAVLRLIFDKTARNASFVVDGQLIDVIKSHPKENLTLLYNAMAACGLNTVDAWKCLLSYARSTVTCAVCRGPILWRKRDANQSEKVDSEWKPESEKKSIDNNVLTFTENLGRLVEKILCATDTFEKSKNYPLTFKQKPTTRLLDIRDGGGDVTAANHYRSFERANTDSDNSTMTFSLSLTDFEQLYSENDSNLAMRSPQHSISQTDLELFRMESEERIDFSDAAATTLKYNQTVIDGEKDFAVQSVLCDNPDHPLEIKDTDYLRVVKNTIDTVKSKASDRRRKDDSEFYLTNTLSIEDIGDYWRQFLYAFPGDRLKLWDVFDKAIKKYYQTLHLRFKKSKEVEKLETENMELKKILKQFMDAEQQDDARLRNVCTPKMKKLQATNSLKKNPEPTPFADGLANVCGSSVHIFTVDRPVKNKKQTRRNDDETTTYF